MTELPMADARQNDKSRKIIHATVAARNLAGGFGATFQNPTKTFRLPKTKPRWSG